LGVGFRLGGGEEPVHLGDRQYLGQRATRARGGDDARGVVAADAVGAEEAVELPDGAQPARAARCRKALRRERGQVGDHLLARGGGRGGAAGAEEGEIIGQIAPIGVDGVARRAALGAQHLEEGLEQVRLAHSTPGCRVTTSLSAAGASGGGMSRTAPSSGPSRAAVPAGASEAAAGSTGRLVSISRKTSG